MSKPFATVLRSFVPALIAACASRAPQVPAVDGQPADLKASAVALYDAYDAALAAPRHGAIAGFYHYEGALIVLNGNVRGLTRDAIDSNYRRFDPSSFD